MRSRILSQSLFTFALVGLIGLALDARAQDDSELYTTEREPMCAQSTAKPITRPPFSSRLPEAQLKHCNSEALYYGFDRASDPQAALECAYYQRAHPDPTVGDPFSGPGVLTMLYANGKGTKRNYNLAIRFARENTWASETELNLWVSRLEHLRDAHAVVSKFDLCNDAISGLMQGACEGVVQRFADVKRDRELASIESQWPVTVQEAFKTLQKAEDDFESARTGKEVDLSGTARAVFSLAEGGRLRDQFLINLKRFARGDIPRVSDGDEALIDHRLNAVYQRVERVPEDSWESTTIKPSGIRDTERVWIKLRDAWVDFGRVAYPNLESAAIVAQLTRLRLHQVQSLLPRN